MAFDVMMFSFLPLAHELLYRPLDLNTPLSSEFEKRRRFHPHGVSMGTSSLLFSFSEPERTEDFRKKAAGYDARPNGRWQKIGCWFTEGAHLGHLRAGAKTEQGAYCINGQLSKQRS